MTSMSQSDGYSAIRVESNKNAAMTSNTIYFFQFSLFGKQTHTKKTHKNKEDKLNKQIRNKIKIKFASSRGT